MKKMIILFSFILFILTGCGNDSKKDSVTVKVRIPTGAPTLSLVKMIYEDESILDYKVEYESVSGPDQLVSAITSKSHEIVIAPTNVGANLYSKNADYVYAATITFGNLFLVSNKPLTLDKLSEETIYAFGKGSTPEITLRKVLGDREVNITFLNNVNDVSSGFVAGTYKVALLAEPVLSLTKTKAVVHTVLDLQDEYKKLMGTSSYPQAGIFINQDFAKKHQKFIEAFLEKVRESTEFVNSNKEMTANYYFEKGLLPNLPNEVLVNSIEGSNIGYLSGKDSKVLIEEYFNIILEYNSELIGGKIPDEDFYLE